MNLAAVMDELAVALKDLTGIRVHAYPPSSVTPPAGVVSYPDQIQYDALSTRGADRITDLPVILVVGKATDRAARNAVAAYANGAGPKSVKATLEDPSRVWTSFDVIHVRECTFDVVTIAAVDYIAAMFAVDLAGSGT